MEGLGRISEHIRVVVQELLPDFIATTPIFRVILRAVGRYKHKSSVHVVIHIEFVE